MLSGERHGKAEAAIDFDVSPLPGPSIESLELYGALSDGGEVFMPLGDDGFSRRFGWRWALEVG